MIRQPLSRNETAILAELQSDARQTNRALAQKVGLAASTALDRTRVHYQPGSLLEAQAVAEVLGLDPKNDVFQMFQDTSAIDQWDEPDVLVALGTDLAAG